MLTDDSAIFTGSSAKATEILYDIVHIAQSQ